MSKQGGLKILCLDGGDARCMSQLYILGEHMHRLEYNLGRKVLPCEHFDLMAAVDSSSPIAIFLGLFRMSVEDAQQAFHDVYTAVINDESSPERRALHLEDVVKKLLDAHSIPDTARMSDFSTSDSSKVALCYSPTARLDTCKFFRNYQSPQQITQDITVIDALRATWAAPGILPSISIGPRGREQTVMSAGTRFANPIREVIKEAYHIFGSEARVSYILSLGSGFRGSVTADDGGRITGGAGMDCERVARDFRRGLTKLKVYYRLSVDRGLEGWESFRGGFGAMKSHVDEYLGQDGPSSDMDQCIAASFIDGRASLGQIYNFKPQGTRSIHGLPPLSAYFVMRKKPMEATIKGLIDGDAFGQRVMIISGMGGSGKTQLALKFARDFQESYQHILFIDASSADSLQKGLISRVRSTRVGCPPSTVEEALETLSNPDEEYDKDWFIIFDNADDPTTPLANYIPPCDHGSVLITTRNPALGNLAPSAHLELRNMEEDEAVEVLLSSAFPPGKIVINPSFSEREAPLPTDHDREIAVAIAKELDCLPIAVVQAGCYIQQHKALHYYLNRLKGNRSDLLQRATSVHRDQLKYSHGVYASFDIVLHALFPRALRLLGVLSFFHFSNFPRPLFAIAAESKFGYEYLELIDRPPKFHEAIQFLNDILCPNEEWREVELDRLLENLQKYSLVTLVPIHNMITLRFHPLVHNWARDQLSVEEKAIYRAAAVRLFICGITKDDDHGILEYLEPHLASISATSFDLHVNDQAAISIFSRNVKKDIQLAVWTRIHAIVEAKYGAQDVRTSRALLQLAGAHHTYAGREKMEALVWNVIAVREAVLGRDHPETATARANLARVLRYKGKYIEAEAIEREVLQVYICKLGLSHRDTAQGMLALATTYQYQWMDRHKDAEGLLSGAVVILTKVAGPAARSTINAIRQLAQCHRDQLQDSEAEILTKKLLLLQQELHGEQHLNTIKSMRWLARRYRFQGRHDEAEALMKIEITTRKQIQGNQHLDTLAAIQSLAGLYEQMVRYEEADQLWNEELIGRRATCGGTDDSTLNAIRSLAEFYERLERYKEAEELREEELAGYRVTRGDTDESTLDLIRSLARFYERLERYEDAEQMWKEELVGRQKACGENDSSTLDLLHSLAKFYERLERYEDAEWVWKEELAGRRATEGDTGYFTLNVIRSLAEMYEKLERYEEAEQLWKEELEGRRATCGGTGFNPLDPIRSLGYDTRDAINSLIGLYMKRGLYEEAERLWKEELAGCRATYGDTDTFTLHIIRSLAQFYENLERNDEAERLWKEELAARRTTWGENDDSTLYSIHLLAGFYERLERYNEAEHLRKEALAARQASDGDDGHYTQEAMRSLVELYEKLERYDDLERLYKKALARHRATRGDNSDRLARDTIHSLARLYEKLKRYEDLEKLWKEELVGNQSTEGDTGLYTMDAMRSLAEVYEKLERYQEAEQLRKEGLVAYRATYGDTDYFTLHAVRSLAELYEKVERYEEAERLWKELPDGWHVNLADKRPKEVDNVVVQEENSPSSSEDAAALDPGGDPTYNPPTLGTLGPSLSFRPQSPFSTRAAFRNTPNSWSMF